MGSKSTFGILLVIAGLVGVWALVTGKLSALVAPASSSSGAASPASSSSTTPAAAQRTGMLSGVPTLNLGTPALAYGVTVGDGGAKIEPIGGATLNG